jgi:sterol desaturase/sphingolipid hydroxylase (fatty acid hydroxylase superfamily)
VIAEPRFHRIHHSLENRHFDKNFAFMFPVWDVIFGTAYCPAADEYPKTGLANQEEPRSILNYVITPFKKRAKKNRGFQKQRWFSGRRLPLP